MSKISEIEDKIFSIFKNETNFDELASILENNKDNEEHLLYLACNSASSYGKFDILKKLVSKFNIDDAYIYITDDLVEKFIDEDKFEELEFILENKSIDDSGKKIFLDDCYIDDIAKCGFIYCVLKKKSADMLKLFNDKLKSRSIEIDPQLIIQMKS